MIEKLKNKVHNMDCVDGLQLMVDNNVFVDGVITSPPYNIFGNKAKYVYDEYNDYKPNDDYCDWTVRIFNLLDKVIKPNGKILYNMSYGSDNSECMNLTVADILRKTNFTLADIIIWEKQTAIPNNVSSNKLTRICEFVYVFCRKSEYNTFTTNKKKLYTSEISGGDIYENIYNKITAKNNDEICPLNKATYSTEFVEKLIAIYFRGGDCILDIFGGTGTTAIACYKNNIDCISFEISSEQCKWANDRYEAESSQIRFFDIP